VLPALDGLPPAEIALGPGDRIGVVRGDGAQDWVDVADFRELDPADLALIRLTAPLPLLEKIRFVVVPLEGDAADMRAALDWTCRKADMVLWCAPHLEEHDCALWSLMPETLRDHAYFAVTAQAARPAEADRMRAADYFSEIRDLSDGPGTEERIARLRTALLAHVSRARREDLEGALIFLDHHLSRAARGRRAGLPAPPDMDAPWQPPAPGPTRPGPDPEPVGDAAGRIADRLAKNGARLAELCAREDGDAAEALDLCTAALDDCAGIARAADGPVAELLDEASELMLLLQLEGSENALADTVALLLQVRRECTAARAA
jgi:hypothetical protein